MLKDTKRNKVKDKQRLCLRRDAGREGVSPPVRLVSYLREEYFLQQGYFSFSNGTPYPICATVS